LDALYSLAFLYGLLFAVGTSWIVAHAARIHNFVEPEEADEYITATLWISTAYLIGFSIYNI